MTESSKPLAYLKMQKNPVQDLKSDVKWKKLIYLSNDIIVVILGSRESGYGINWRRTKNCENPRIAR